MALLRSWRLPKARLLLLPVLALLPPLLRAQPVPPLLCGLDYLEDTDAPGQWTPRPHPPHFDTMTAHEMEQLHGYECPDFYHLCARRSDADLARTKALSMWDWQPAECTLPPFNGDAFYARFLQSNVTLLMVGDSITQEHYVSLTCQLSKHIVTRTEGDPPLRLTAVLASGATINYVRNNHLVHADTHLVLHTRHADATDDQYPWVTHLPSSSHDVLILNTGAHWADKMSIMSIHNVLDHLAAHFKGVVIYRGAHEGYDHCEQHSSPVAAHDVPTNYNWGLLALYNDHWRTAIRRLRRKGHPFFYVDVATPLRHRPDARSNPPRDCLHVCMPGPIDLFNQVMEAALVEAGRWEEGGGRQSKRG